MVHATINEANLAPLLRAVNHSDSNDNEGFFEEIKITQEYCSYPIPEKYQLSVVVHEVSGDRHSDSILLLLLLLHDLCSANI